MISRRHVCSNLNSIKYSISSEFDRCMQYFAIFWCNNNNNIICITMIRMSRWYVFVFNNSNTAAASSHIELCDKPVARSSISSLINKNALGRLLTKTGMQSASLFHHFCPSVGPVCLSSVRDVRVLYLNECTYCQTRLRNDLYCIEWDVKP